MKSNFHFILIYSLNFYVSTTVFDFINNKNKNM